jgi:hypothetical protein
MIRSPHTTAVAYLALFAALGGSAYAAVTVTGKNIKDGTITGRDVKNRSLATSKLTTRAVSSLIGERGPQGPQGQQGVKGDPGEAGFGRAFATVVSVTPPEFKGDTKNVTAVTRPAGQPVGVYCLTLAEGISPVNTHAVASPEWSTSTGFDVFVMASNEVSACPQGTLEIRTYDLPGPNLSDDVSFNIIVP